MSSAARIKAVCLAIGVLASSYAMAEVSSEELNAQSEAKAKATENVKPTPEMVKAKVLEACALVEQEGAAALPKMQGSDTDFIFAGTYVWINDMDCIMVMHPMKYKLNGKPLMNIKDTNGKALFVEFVNVCRDKGEGWADYMWPKPGETTPVPKVSFVKKAVTPDGQEWVVGSGLYDVPAEEINTLVNN